MSQSQSADSHAKMVPLYHYVVLPLLLIVTVFFGSQMFNDFSVPALMMTVFGVATFLAALFARVFALGVQDRVIRLEERLRLGRVLPADMHGDIDGIPTNLLIGLRFAPDAELESLTRKILAGELKDRKAVKQAIGQWRADHQRI